MINMNGNKRITEIEKNEKIYSQRRKQDRILVLNEKLQDLSEKVDEKVEINKLYELIRDAENKKAQKIIGRQSDKCKSEILNIDAESKRIMDSGEIERPCTMEKSVYYVSENGEDFYVGKSPLPNSNDGYSKIIRTAFHNEKQRAINIYEIEPTDASKYVKNEMQELQDVEEFWQTEQIEKKLAKLDREDPKEAQKYRSSQIKKMQVVRDLRKLYQDISIDKMSLDKIEKALTELENQKTNLPENVYNKAQKSLLVQKKKEEKKYEKLERKKDRIFQKSGIRTSINNAKRYKSAVSELNSLTNGQTLENDLDKLKNNLNLAKMKLHEEYENGEVTYEQRNVEVRSGEVYETGELTSSRANQAEIDKAKEEVSKLERQLIEKQNAIRENNLKRERLEAIIESIADDEIETTKEGVKGDEKALPTAQSFTKTTTQEELTAHQKFAAKYSGEVSHEKAATIIEKKNQEAERNLNSTEERDVDD